MRVDYKIKKGESLTSEQKRRIDRASSMPITYDEDSPRLTPEQIDEMRRIAILQRESRKKQTISLRLDWESINLAQSFGKGYTGLLSRILYKALRDPEYIKDCL